MTEDEFADRLAKKLNGRIGSHEVAVKKSLLYDLSFDHNWTVSINSIFCR